MLRLCGIWKIGKKNVRAWISLPCTRRDTQSAHTYTRTHRERDTHASAYTIACLVPRNFVRHARCRMLCALPVTRILNTKFNFFFFSLPPVGMVVCNIRARKVRYYWIPFSPGSNFTRSISTLTIDVPIYTRESSLFSFLRNGRIIQISGR